MLYFIFSSPRLALRTRFTLRAKFCVRIAWLIKAPVIQSKYLESENFSDSSLHRIFDSENFRFPFSTKNCLTRGAKWEKLNLGKQILGNLLEKL